MSAPGTSRGLFASGQRLLGTALELLQVRVDLLVLELEQEKLRLFDALWLAVVALLGLGIGALLLCAWLVLLADATQRMLVLALLALAFLVGGGWALWAARARLSHRGLFKHSAAEWARDREVLAAATARDERNEQNERNRSD